MLENKIRLQHPQWLRNIYEYTDARAVGEFARGRERTNAADRHTIAVLKSKVANGNIQRSRKCNVHAY